MNPGDSRRRQGANTKLSGRGGARKGAVPSSGEELYRKIFDHSNDAIYVIDPSNGAIVDVNPSACAMLGYSREELLSIPISAVHPDEMPLLQAFAQSVFDKGRGWTNELTCLTKGGQKLPAEISASPIDVFGGKQIIAMVRDITERRKAEAAERELVIVEERNRLAREIHDSLAQGLTAIIWQLNAAERPVAAGGSEALKSLEQVRDLARESLQEARRSVWDLRSGPLKGLSLSQALEQEANKAAGANIQAAFTLKGRERVIPAGVEAALLRICQEALANVLKHASANQVSVSITFSQSNVRLNVGDDGVGFDPKIPGQWNKDQGGFGLVSMRERAQLLGGHLTIKSTVGKGTIVSARVPAERART